jgi:hypothetical protein
MTSSMQACKLSARAASMIECILDDADGDIAALVYEADDRPDVVLCDFADHVRAEGRHVSGLVQFRDHDHSDTSRRLVVLDAWRRIDVRRSDRSKAARRIHIDGRGLDRIVRRVENEIERGTAVVVASRFGPLELAGGGFCQVIRRASQTRTPLVIAVPRNSFDCWTRFSGGMAVRLECRMDDVLGWWYGLTRPAGAAGRARSLCELVK